MNFKYSLLYTKLLFTLSQFLCFINNRIIIDCFNYFKMDDDDVTYRIVAGIIFTLILFCIISCIRCCIQSCCRKKNRQLIEGKINVQSIKIKKVWMPFFFFASFFLLLKHESAIFLKTKRFFQSALNFNFLLKKFLELNIGFNFSLKLKY